MVGFSNESTFFSAASISASSNPTSSSPSANLLDGMVCVNDTYMLPGRNNLSITVVSDPQRAAAAVSAGGAPTTRPATSAPSTPTGPAPPAGNFGAVATRNASELEHKKQLLINPLTGSLSFHSLALFQNRRTLLVNTEFRYGVNLD